MRQIGGYLIASVSLQPITMRIGARTRIVPDRRLFQFLQAQVPLPVAVQISQFGAWPGGALTAGRPRQRGPRGRPGRRAWRIVLTPSSPFRRSDAGALRLFAACAGAWPRRCGPVFSAGQTRLSGPAARAASRYCAARVWLDGLCRDRAQPPGQLPRAADGAGCCRYSTQRQQARRPAW
jgi:hypothetical protein